MKTRMMIVVVLSMMSLVPAAFGQDKLDKLFSETTPQERAELQTENMQEKLALRDDQKSKVYDINFKYAQKMENTYRAGGGKLQRLKNMKAVGQEKDGELKKVLDADQYKTYEKYKEEMKENMKAAAKEKKKSN